jgi:hypothetical protein
MKTVSTFKRSILGLAAAGVFATSLFGAGSASAAGTDSLADSADPTAECWTLPDGTVKCKACVYYDGGHSCFLYVKKPAPSTTPSNPPTRGTTSDLITMER